MQDDILTIEEVASYLRVSDRTVYDWAQKGEIPAGKIGTVWRFKKSEVEKWVNERLSSGPSSKKVVEEVQMKNILSPDRVVLYSPLHIAFPYASFTASIVEYLFFIHLRYFSIQVSQKQKFASSSLSICHATIFLLSA